MVFNPFTTPEDEDGNEEKNRPNRGVTISSKPISEEIIRRFGEFFYVCL